jgi:MFS family permease
VTIEATRPGLAAAPSRGGVFRGWFVVTAAFGVLFVAYGLQFSFGVFVKAIEDDVGWSRSQLSTPYAIYVFLYSALSSFSGSFTDRRGPRTVILVGGLFLAAGYIGFGLSQELWQVYLTLGLIAGIGMSAAWVPCNATVVRWFTRRRGLAVGIASTGGSMGNLAVPPIATALIEAFGWRTALVSMGAAGAVLLAIGSRYMIRSPEEVGLHPDGDPEPLLAAPIERAPGAPGTDATTDPVVAARTDFTAAEARRTTTFWVLLCTFGLTWLVVFVPYVHLAPFAEDLGLSKQGAALVVSSIGLGGIAGRLSVGWASDRIGSRFGLACMLALQVVAFAGFAASNGPGLLYPSAVVFGASYGGATTLFPAITSDFFGRTYTGAIVGLVFAIAGSSAAVGPFVAGALYDATGSYRVAFVLSAACNLAAIGLVAVLRAPRRATENLPAAVAS